MIPYVSIDIETSGIDPNNCVILEFGAVIDDWKTPVEKLPTFHTYIKHWKLVGEPYALSMHSTLLLKIAECDDSIKYNPQPPFTTEKLLLIQFAEWLRKQGLDPLKVQVAGKNFASFDLQFLNRLTGYGNCVRFKHRTIDPAMFYWTPGEEVPGTEECKKRAGLAGEVKHTAIEDALDVVRLVREHWYRTPPTDVPGVNIPSDW